MKLAGWWKSKQTKWKTAINSINYDVAYESSLSSENHEGILVTHSTGPSELGFWDWSGAKKE